MTQEATEDYLQERASIAEEYARHAEEVAALKEQVRRLETENAIWRNMVTAIREVATRYAPIVAQTRELDWVYNLMRYERAMREEIDRRIRQVEDEFEGGGG